MKKILTTNYNTAQGGESAERLIIYALEGDDWERLSDLLEEGNFAEIEDIFDICDMRRYPYAVPAGAVFETYAYHLHDEHFVIAETIARNV